MTFFGKYPNNTTSDVVIFSLISLYMCMGVGFVLFRHSLVFRDNFLRQDYQLMKNMIVYIECLGLISTKTRWI